MTNKGWFQKQLKLIEIEVFSYCNRQCWFCPNSHIDRLSTNKIMPEEMYLSILEQLKEIEYNQEVTYSRYNEPLADKELIIKTRKIKNIKMLGWLNEDQLIENFQIAHFGLMLYV